MNTSRVRNISTLSSIYNVLCSSVDWIDTTPSFFEQVRLGFKVKESCFSGKILNIELLQQLGIDKCGSLSYDARYDELIFNSFVKQVVGVASKSENDLLDRGRGVFFGHEVMVIRAKSNSGRVINSELIHGGSFFVSSLANIYKEIYALIAKISNQGETLEELELVHTHPSLDVILGNDSKLIYVINGLSETDLFTALNITKKFTCRCEIKAISGSKVTYSYRF